MQESILYIVLALLCVVIYLLINQKKNKDDGKNNEELDRLKDSLTSSISTMSSSFNTLSIDFVTLHNPRSHNINAGAKPIKPGASLDNSGWKYINLYLASYNI